MTVSRPRTRFGLAPAPCSWARASALALALLPGGTVFAASAPAAFDSGVRDFVTNQAAELGYGQDELAALMADARYQQDIIDAMNRPYEAKPWRAYRPLFLTEERINGGVAFLRHNAAVLDRAEAAYGVPPEVITAIIGIETNYGGTLGKHRVLDALSTLGFTYPSRAPFFSKELGEFLRLTREEGIDPLTVTGSYAGAVGKPQFIPSSYRAYAVDFDQDGRKDLWESNEDVIGSVGNYLALHGWRRGAPVAVPAVLDRGRPAGIPIAEKRPVRPEQGLTRLAAAGVEPAQALPADAPSDLLATLIALDGVETEYWLGFENFYAITRYNHSNLYAMAVFQLSRQIADRAAGAAADDASD